MKEFDFNNLFIFELANNHQGDVDHGLAIIRNIGNLAKQNAVRGGIKFQFRQLDTFIHPDYKNNLDIKHIKRFMETRLDDSQFQVLINETKKQLLIPIGTAFDEASVKQMLDMGIEIIKVASCSAVDQPLIKEIVNAKRPVIVSTAGMNINQIDRLVSYFQLKNVHFAIMHCIALYPSPHEKLRLNQIELLRKRFPAITIGFSTHEHPDNYASIQIAFAKGARIFERHIDMETGEYKMNAYSSSPKQIDSWLKSYKEAVDMCGGDAERPPSFPEELSSLNSLKRGVYASRNIDKGIVIRREDVFFAMPLQEGQMKSDRWLDSEFKADKSYLKNLPLSAELTPFDYEKSENLIFQVTLLVKAMLNNANISFGQNSSIEISHHFGLDRFREFGAVIIDCVNRDYCKKLIVQLARQKHPYHYHKRKEETFQLLHGDLEVYIEGKSTQLKIGDTLLIEPNQWHKFQTLHGAVFEEISTHHYDNDSFYEDERITMIAKESRKTKIPNWEAAVIEKL